MVCKRQQTSPFTLSLHRFSINTGALTWERYGQVEKIDSDWWLLLSIKNWSLLLKIENWKTIDINLRWKSTKGQRSSLRVFGRALALLHPLTKLFVHILIKCHTHIYKYIIGKIENHRVDWAFKYVPPHAGRSKRRVSENTRHWWVSPGVRSWNHNHHHHHHDHHH